MNNRDSAYNQIPTKARISTTKKTEQVYVNGHYYRWYPRIREKDISSNTSQLFIDTLQICNLYLKGMGGDYDGDQVGIRGVFSVEANKELEEFRNSKRFYLTLGGINNKVSSNEAIQSLFNLTLVLPSDKDKLSNPSY